MYEERICESKGGYNLHKCRRCADALWQDLKEKFT